MKRMISLMLVLALVLGVCPATFAVESEEENMLQDIPEMYDGDIPQEIMDKYYTLTDEEEEAIPIIPNYMAESIILDSPNEHGKEVRAIYASSLVRATYQKVGPYKNISTMPANSIKIMLANLQGMQALTFYADEEYYGYDCYVFTDASTQTQVYVAAEAFWTDESRIYPLASSASNTLTTYINNKNTNWVCSTRAYATPMGVADYNWTISQFGSQAYPFSDTEMVIKNKLLYSVTLQSSSFHLLVHSTGYISYAPELTLKITDGGTNNAYFGAFAASGLGDSTGTLDISTLLNLGYNTARLFSTPFNKGTFRSVLNDATSLKKSLLGSQYKYSSYETTVLSNPSKNVYTRECKLKCPFTLSRPDNVFELRIGVVSVASNIKYAATVNYNI